MTLESKCTCKQFPINWAIIHICARRAALTRDIKEEMQLLKRECVELDEIKYCPWCGCKANPENLVAEIIDDNGEKYYVG
jgi:hypothetical protein